MIRRIFTIAILVGLPLAAQEPSQPPVPGVGNEQEQPQQQPTASSESAESPNEQPTTNATVSVQVEGADEQRDRPQEYSTSQNQQAPSDWWSGVSAIASAVQAVFAFVLILLTGALVYAAWSQSTAVGKQTGVLAETLTATKEIERGYVNIAHISDKLNFDEPGAIWFEVDIRNQGRTPVDVLGGVMTIEIGPVPPATVPTSQYTKIPPAFFVPEKRMRFKSMIFGLDDARLTRAKEPLDLEGETSPLDLWVVGYVDYRDRFGGVHRGGYGRHLQKYTKDLVWDETTRNMNYDRPLTAEQRQQYENHGQPEHQP